MSRLIDTLPEPEHVVEKKVIIVSRSRVGTFSLYQAMKMLGYKPYHMFEAVVRGATHLRIFQEALSCKYLGTGKPYGKAEFDKWLANYDTIIEVPQFFLEEFISFYPDAKFVLTERDMDAWTKSMNNTVVPVFQSMHAFPMNVIGLIDSFMDAVVKFHVTTEEIMFHGKGAGSAEGMKLCQEDTRKINEKARKLAPKDQLLICRLEDGFGFEQLCPFLDKEMPPQKYPKGNAPAEFNAMFGKLTTAAFRRAGVILGTTVLVPTVAAAIGLWYWQA